MLEETYSVDGQREEAEGLQKLEASRKPTEAGRRKTETDGRKAETGRKQAADGGQKVKTKKFNCRRCGACCRIKDGIVRVSDGEIKRIAEFLGMGEVEFIAKETELSPDRRSLVLKNAPDGACAYLTPDSLCHINPVKPDKCRTFPFEWANPDSANVCPELTPRQVRVPPPTA